jgi:hypothetical protein
MSCLFSLYVFIWEYRRPLFCDRARRCLNPCNACTCFFGCARRCPTCRFACTTFVRGCARRSSTRRMTCICFFRSCSRRCPTRHSSFSVSCVRKCPNPALLAPSTFAVVLADASAMCKACMRFLSGCARRCPAPGPRIACLHCLKMRLCLHVLDPSHGLILSCDGSKTRK